MKYILKGFIYLFIFLLAVSSASAYIPDEGYKGVYIILVDNDIIYCNNTNCYLVTSIDAFETCVNTDKISCTTVSPLEFTRSCIEGSTFCSLFVSDNWEDWFYFGFESLGKEPKFAKIAFILAHTMYLDSGADTDPTTEHVLSSLLDIDLSSSGANRLHAFILALYLANRNIPEDTTFVNGDLKKIFRASIKSAPRILVDVFDETILMRLSPLLKPSTKEPLPMSQRRLLHSLGPSFLASFQTPSLLMSSSQPSI